ncbi:hypothetical protein ACTUVK_001685 [Stenotrophomonas rhizophila]
MTRGAGLTLALLLALHAAPGVHAAPHAPAPASAARPLVPVPADLAAALDAAAEQGQQGDARGAGEAFDRLLQDPRLTLLDDTQRSAVWMAAAWTAGTLEQWTLARQRVQEALRLDPSNSLARYFLGSLQIDAGELDQGADSIIRAVQTEPGTPTLRTALAWALAAHLRDQPARLRPFLQALFDKGWTSDGVEPDDLWLSLATLQADAGEAEALATTLSRIDGPRELIALRSDKRFDPYLKRDDPRLDPVRAVHARIASLSDTLRRTPQFNDLTTEFGRLLLVAGREEEVLTLTEPLLAIAAGPEALPAEQRRSVAWLLDQRATALRRRGEHAQAVASLRLAVRAADPTGDTVSQRLNLGVLLAGLEQPEPALAEVSGLGDVSAYGESTRALVELVSALQLRDAARADRARTALAAVRAQAPQNPLEGLLADDRMDDAATALRAMLASPRTRVDALLSLQDMRTVPALPGDAARTARWRQLKQRPDVQAAVRQVGRIERYALYGDDDTR